MKSLLHRCLPLGLLLAMPIAVAVSPRVAHAQGKRPPPALSSFHWLAGSWEGADGVVVVEQTWTLEPRALGKGGKPGKPGEGGGGMVARVLRAGASSTLEIREGGGGVVLLVAAVGGQGPVELRWTGGGTGQSMFENPGAGFPKRVLFRANLDGTLRMRTEGERGGKPVIEDVKLARRAAFPPPAPVRK